MLKMESQHILLAYFKKSENVFSCKKKKISASFLKN